MLLITYCFILEEVSLPSASRHAKRHTRPFKCTVNGCGWAFALKKDLDRHRKTKHPQMVERFVPLYCPFERCKYSEGMGRGFSRADNLNRHVNTHARNGGT